MDGLGGQDIASTCAELQAGRDGLATDEIDVGGEDWLVDDEEIESYGTRLHILFRSVHCFSLVLLVDNRVRSIGMSSRSPTHSSEIEIRMPLSVTHLHRRTGRDYPPPPIVSLSNGRRQQCLCPNV